MRFLSSYFLWLIPLAALPVIIHLLNRSAVKKVEFSTLRFLQPATKRILKRFKFLQWLLLFLRVGIILFLTFAFARPIWRGYTREREILYNIILIDNSYSMEYRFGKENALELSKELAVRLIRELDGQFAVGTINDGLERLSQFSDNKKAVMEEIIAIKNSPYSTDLLKGIKETIDFLRSEIDTDIKKNIIIISDFNRDSISTENELIVAENTEFLLIDTSDGSSNVWVKSVNMGTPYTGIPFKIISAFNTVDETEAKVSLYIEGKRRNHKVIKISKDKSNDIEFRYTFKHPGLYAGRIEIESPTRLNRIDIDDIYYFHAYARPRIKVLVVDGNPGYTLMGGESYFITKALSPANYDTPTTPRVINPAELKTTDEDDYDVWLLLNLKLDQEIIDKVTGFSKKGGGLGIFMGNNVDYDLYNRFIGSFIPVEITVPRPIELQDIKIKVSEKFKKIFLNSNIIFKNLFETRGDPHEKPEITVNKFPLLWLYSPGVLIRGRVALFTSTADMDWTDFPLKPSFPAFIQELVIYLSGGEETDSNFIKVGKIIPVNKRNMDKIKIDSKIDGGLNTNTGIASAPGNYISERGGDRKIYSVNVNTESGESALNQLSESEIRKVFTDHEIYYIPYSEKLRQDIVRTITGEEKSLIFLAGAFIFLIFEELLRKYLQHRVG